MRASEKANDCQVVTATTPTSACVIPTASSSCTFGDTTSNNNCYDQKVYMPYTSGAGAPTVNLFCNSSGETIACPSTIVNYRDDSPSPTNSAFPSANDKNGPYTPVGSGCIPFTPGSSTIPPAPTAQCSVDGERSFGPDASSVTTITPTLLSTYQECYVGRVTVHEDTPEEATSFCRSSTFGSAGNSFFECSCDVSNNPNYNFFLCATGLLPASSCEELCVLQEAQLNNPLITKKAPSVSPLGFLNTIAEFLFGIAIIIFIINLLHGSFLFVSSGGDEGKMKEAQTLITNTIFGMIFVVFIGSLLRWVLAVTGTIISG
jgi:hypothetical protein